MANLKPLIKVRKHDVEQRQKRLAILYDRDVALQEKAAQLEEKVETERARVKDMDVTMQSYFRPFADAVKKQVSDIDRKRQNLAKQITIARNAVRTAFADMKKVEITARNRDAEALSALNKKESDVLDEIGIERFGKD